MFPIPENPTEEQIEGASAIVSKIGPRPQRVTLAEIDAIAILNRAAAIRGAEIGEAEAEKRRLARRALIEAEAAQRQEDWRVRFGFEPVVKP